MRRIIAAFAALALLASGLMYLPSMTGGPDRESPRDLLLRSQLVMRDQSFAASHLCPGCSTPAIYEYAPPDRIRLSNSPGHDDWAYYLLIDDTGYFSGRGVRWMTGDAARAALMVLLDPRELPGFIDAETLEGAEEVNGEPATIIAARLDMDRYFERVAFAQFDEETRTAIRDVYGPLVARFWVDSDDGRILQLAMGSPEGETYPLAFDFESHVDVPTAVESMPWEQAHRLGQEAEPRGLKLLHAVGRYEQQYGRFPESLDEVTLAGVLEGQWPLNAFSGQPMKHAPDSPGDFSYILKNGGQDIEFGLNGWDDLQMYYDSERFGPIYIP